YRFFAPPAAGTGDELPALVLVARGAQVEGLVVARDEAALAGGDVLFQLKRERTKVADRAEGAAFVGRAHRLRGVLDDANGTRPRDRHDRVHVGRAIVEVDGHDRDRARRDLRLDIGRVEAQRLV